MLQKPTASASRAIPSESHYSVSTLVPGSNASLFFFFVFFAGYTRPSKAVFYKDRWRSTSDVLVHICTAAPDILAVAKESVVALPDGAAGLSFGR